VICFRAHNVIVLSVICGVIVIIKLQVLLWTEYQIFVYTTEIGNICVFSYEVALLFRLCHCKDYLLIALV